MFYPIGYFIIIVKHLKVVTNSKYEEILGWSYRLMTITINKTIILIVNSEK